MPDCSTSSSPQRPLHLYNSPLPPNNLSESGGFYLPYDSKSCTKRITSRYTFRASTGSIVRLGTLCNVNKAAVLAKNKCILAILAYLCCYGLVLLPANRFCNILNLHPEQNISVEHSDIHWITVRSAVLFGWHYMPSLIRLQHVRRNNRCLWEMCFSYCTSMRNRFLYLKIFLWEPTRFLRILHSPELSNGYVYSSIFEFVIKWKVVFRRQNATLSKFTYHCKCRSGMKDHHSFFHQAAGGITVIYPSLMQ